MTTLQTLHFINLGMYGAVDVIKELGKLMQIRDLGSLQVRRENGSIFSSSIDKMLHLEKLFVESSDITNDVVVDLHLISPPTMLRKLTLCGRHQKFAFTSLKLFMALIFTIFYSYRH